MKRFLENLLGKSDLYQAYLEGTDASFRSGVELAQIYLRIHGLDEAAGKLQELLDSMTKQNS